MLTLVFGTLGLTFLQVLQYKRNIGGKEAFGSLAPLLCTGK
jgi:hypothetical protein